MLAIETILGALTGYFTNDIAIRQLFSKNGLVVREREQFTTLIVQVLKEKIIDTDTMNELRDRPEMVRFFEEFVHALLSEVFPTALLQKRLADYDSNGALRGFLKGYVADASMHDVVLDVSLVHTHLDELIQSEAFKQTLLQSVRNIAALSLTDLGLERVVNDGLTRFVLMDNEAWQAWLLTRKQQVMSALQIETEESQQTVKNLLSVDGAFIVKKIEAYFGVDFSKQEQLEQWKACFTQFLEQLYVFAARVLPSFFEAHLPTLLEAVYPMLQDDREWIEKMVLESIEVCNTDGNMILSVASGYVQKFFAPDENGKDWLTKLYDVLQREENSCDLCTRFSDFLCGLVMTQIDSWRHLNLDTEEAIQKVKMQYSAVRALVIKGLDAYLSMPAQGNIVHRILLQGVSSLSFAWLAKAERLENLQTWITNNKVQWLNQPLAQLFFDEACQEKLVNAFCDWWHDEGLAWLSTLDGGEKSIKQSLYNIIDGLFDMPLKKLFDDAQGLIPFEALADGLRMMFFNHLRDFLAGLTQDQLDALSHEEIREVVLDMIGREMRPLAYLGGGIGALAGVATGAAMQASGVMLEQEQLSLLVAARSGMYGAVGYGTNVMAVKGLFWPYKKTLGLQGLISKNQSRFADKMKSMAESYIINDKIWMQQVKRVSAYVGQHNDDIMRYALHLMDENRDSILRSFVEGASHELPHRIFSGVFDEQQTTSLMKRLSERGVHYCLNETTIARVAVRLQVAHYGVCKLAMAEARDHVWSEKLVQLLQGFSVEDWINKGNMLLEQCHLPKNEVFFEKIWLHVLPYYQSLPERLLLYVHDIAGGLDRYISKKLSFPLQLAYRMAGGERQIEYVLTHFITYKLPEYVQARGAQVERILKKWAMVQFGGHNLSECGVTFSKAQGQWMYEWAQTINANRLHGHVMALFVCLEKMPKGYFETLTREAARMAKPFAEGLEAFLKQTKTMQYIHWNEFAHSATPVFELLRENVFFEISLGEIFSVSDQRIWNWTNTMLSLSNVEKNSVIACAQGLWDDVAPSFWDVVGQRGRVLMMMIDIPALTHDRICALSPQALEVMVRDIAQPYFTRVERMGWLGAVVAVPATIISMMLGGM